MKVWRSTSFHNRHVMNKCHHVEGRKPGKETEQLDIFKNKYVRKQTNQKYRKKMCLFLCAPSQNLKQAITRAVVRKDSVFFFFFLILLSPFVQTGWSVWHFGWIFSKISKWVMTSQWFHCKADSVKSLVWNDFQLLLSVCLHSQCCYICLSLCFP